MQAIPPLNADRSNPVVALSELMVSKIASTRRLSVTSLMFTEMSSVRFCQPNPSHQMFSPTHRHYAKGL